MARKVDEFPEVPSRSRYPWDTWLDGGIWELTQGEDFKGRAATFKSNARSQAKRRGGKVRARILRPSDAPDRLYIQYFREPET